MKNNMMANGQSTTSSFYQEWLTVENLSAYLSLSKSTIYKKVFNRLIPHYKREGSLYFKKVEIDTWIEVGKVDMIKTLQNNLSIFSPN